MINRKFIGFNLLILRDTQVVQRQDVSCFRDFGIEGNQHKIVVPWKIIGI